MENYCQSGEGVIVKRLELQKLQAVNILVRRQQIHIARQVSQV
jgi:hypothetical protein